MNPTMDAVERALSDFGVSPRVLALFAGLTTYDMQVIKLKHAQGSGQETNGKPAIGGGLSLPRRVRKR
jgi:hypothetical protein